MDSEAGVLAGIRVVEIAGELASAITTRWFAELGAEVVKVEPAGGDPMRKAQPAAFATWNRSKRVVVLDTDVDADRSTLHGLLADADVLIHGWTAGQSDRRGLSVDALHIRYPSLVVGTVTAYPRGHEDAERYGDELLVQARLGIMDEQEALRAGPMFIRLPVASWGAAYLLAGGVAARLLERERTGHAHAIHTSLAQGALAPAALYWQRAGAPPKWLHDHTLPKLDEPPHITIFECADGRWLQVMGGFTKFDQLRAVLAEAGEDDLFGGRADRDNRDRWAKVFALRTVEEWTQLMWPAGALCMPILDVGEILGTEQARANGYVVDVNDPVFGATVQAGAPFEVNGPAVVRNPAPPVPAADTPIRWTSPNHPTERLAPAPREMPPDLPLSGLRVVDFGAYVAGPFGSQCLADFGADVIKVEPLGGEKGREINQFTGCQRGKRSIEIDLRHPRAREVLDPLIASADVVMHNVRLQASRKLGVDEDSVRSINPSVVFAHSSGYGTAGPLCELPAFDPTACALSGWAHGISGPGRRPSWLRMSAMDCITGMSNFVGVTLALLERARTGRPGRASTSLLAVAIGFTSETLLAGPELAPAPYGPVNGDQTGFDSWRRIFEVADGWVAISATTDAQRAAVRRILGDDPAQFTETARTKRVAALLSAFGQEAVPAEQVMIDNRDALFDAELVSGSGLVRRTEGTPYGWFENPGGFWSDESGVVRNDRPIPASGQHTEELLRELGFSESKITELVNVGVAAIAANG